MIYSYFLWLKLRTNLFFTRKLTVFLKANKLFGKLFDRQFINCKFPGFVHFLNLISVMWIVIRNLISFHKEMIFNYNINNEYKLNHNAIFSSDVLKSKKKIISEKSTKSKPWNLFTLETYNVSYSFITIHLLPTKNSLRYN